MVDALAGAALGLGVYTSAAAVVMMPLYFAITVAVLCWSRAMTRPQALAFAAAFAAAAAPLFASWLARPELFRQVVSAHHLYDAARFNPLQGVHEMVSWVGLTARTEVFYDYFNPAFLFLSGRVFLAPLVVLVPIGLYQLALAEASAGPTADRRRLLRGAVCGGTARRAAVGGSGAVLCAVGGGRVRLRPRPAACFAQFLRRIAHAGAPPAPMIT